VTDPGNAVFLSYASQDAEAAQQLCNALRAAGIEVWFDRSELRGGDAWDQKIRREIRECALFIPIISTNTQARPEGYFRLEWRLADQRTHLMGRSRAFLVPVCIDDTRDADADVPDSFAAVQWTRLPEGEIPPAFTARIAALLGGPGAAFTSKSTPLTVTGEVRAASAKPASRARLAVIGLTTLVVVGLVYVVFQRAQVSRQPLANHPTAAVAPQAPNRPAAAQGAFTPPPHSIAVLPFVNMSGDAKQEYFSDGVTEELLNSLSRLDQLQVTARTSSFSFKGQNVDVSTIAHKLNVGTILEGSVRRAGTKVRITVQLINAVSGFHIWSQTYDRQSSDVLKVQTDIATSIAQQLQVKLFGDETTKLELGGTKNPDAYDAYLRGKQIVRGPNPHGETTRDALAAFDKAIAMDPNFAKAYADRAWALHGIAVGVQDPQERAALREQALTAAQRAVALAPDLGETHAALAAMRSYAFFDYAGAAPEFERALALSPGNANVQWAFAWYAADLGHFDQAISAARRAVSLDPENATPHGALGFVLSYARRYPEALAAYQDVKVLRPQSLGVEGAIAQTLLASGQVEQARQVCESPSTKIDESDRHQCLALAYHFLGRQTEAQRELAKYQALEGESGAYSYAGIYSQWGDAANALHWLTKAEERRDPLLWLLRIDWQLDPIRNEPGFKAIVARMNFPP
jgi:TolB-like protein/tetratricopeptide (TPR) repeat protein